MNMNENAPLSMTGLTEQEAVRQPEEQFRQESHPTPHVEAEPEEELVAEEMVTPADNVPEDGEEPAAKKDEYWRNVLTGNPDTVPEDVWRRAGADDAGLSREQQEYALYSSVNRSWVADHRDFSRREVMADWKKHRSELARELGVSDDEREVFMALSAREREAPRREAAQRVYEMAYRAGLDGVGDYDTRPFMRGLTSAERDSANVVALQAYMEGQQHREASLPLARDLADAVDVFAAVEEDVFSAPRVLAGAPGLVRAVDSLVDMPEEERQRVVYLAAGLDRAARRERGDEPQEEGLFSRAVRAARRGASSMGFGVLQAMNHAGVATLDNIGSALGGELGDELQQGAQAWDKRLQVLNEIRHLSQQDVLPLLPQHAGKAETLLIESAQAVPAAVLSCCGGAGFAALALSGMGESVAEARRRAPEGPQQLQLAAGVVGGAVQGAIYMGMNRIGGRLFEQTVSKFMKARGSGLVNYTLAGLQSMGGMTVEGVKLMLAGKAAAAADLGVHELAARASSTASNIDWQAFGDNMTDIEVNMREAAAILPFVLIGAGRMALRHFRSSNSVLGSGQRLLEWGVDEAKVRDIMSEQDIDAKSNMLREAVRESELWNSKRYSMDVWRAMQLLNTDKQKPFRDVEVVRDFLQLPPGFAVKTEQQSSASPAKQTVREGLALRDEWEEKAGSDFNGSALPEWRRDGGKGYRGLVNGRGKSPNAYMFAYDNPVKENERLHSTGLYHPRAEIERRELLSNYIERLKGSSYRLLLQLYSQDVLTHSRDMDVADVAKTAEKKRRDYLELVAGSVLDIAGGKSRAEVYNNMARRFASYLRQHREPSETARAEWVQRVPEAFIDRIEDYSRKFEHKSLDDYAEFRDFLVLLKDSRVGVDVLADLLPMSEDFQTMLARGYSPVQTFRHFLNRELGLSLHGGEVAEPTHEEQNLMRQFSEKNSKRVALYTQMTGRVPERAPGEDGKMYYRFRRPDGSHTRWHESEQHAVNDLASNVDLAFQPLGQSAHKFWLQSGHRPAAITRLPMAGADEFSGYDQLCLVALRDLSAAWLEDASHTLPGLQRSKIHRIHHAAKYGEELNPIVKKGEGENQYRADRLTSLTPLGLAQSRFYVYWLQQIKSGMLSAEHVGDYLLAQGAIDDKRLQSIMKIAEPLPYPRRRNIPLKDTPEPDIEGMRSELAREMGKLSTMYFLSRLPELDVPDTVKNWYAGAAFAPEYENAMELAKDEKGNLLFLSTRKTAPIIRWANHRTSVRLHEIAPEIEHYRKQFAHGTGDELIERLMPGALAQDRVLQLEQSWSHRRCDDAIFVTAGPEHWNLLRFPREGWELLSPAAKEAYTKSLVPVLSRHHIAPEFMSEEEVMEYAINNLAEMLDEHPELHEYSLADAPPGHVERLNPAPRRQFPEPDYRLVREYEPGMIRADYDVSAEGPSPLLADEKVRRAIYTLDALRRYPSGLPGDLGYAIYWNNEYYGGRLGNRPAGLEQTSPRPPMWGVHEMLGQVIMSRAGDEEHSFELCGTHIPVLSAEELMPQALESITVYPLRMQKNAMYRLMPGNPGSSDEKRRFPYLVGVDRRGYFTQQGEYAGGLTDEVTIPLHEFRRKWRGLRLGHFDSEKLLRAEMLRTLEKVFVLADRGADAPDIFRSEYMELPELMMRLFEDSGFSHRLEEKSLSELNQPVAEALALAAHLHTCMAALEDGSPSYLQSAFRELKSCADEIRRSPVQILRLTEGLVSGRDLALEEGGTENESQPVQSEDLERKLLRRFVEMSNIKVSDEQLSDVSGSDDLYGYMLRLIAIEKEPSPLPIVKPEEPEDAEELGELEEFVPRAAERRMKPSVAELLGIDFSDLSDILKLRQQAAEMEEKYRLRKQGADYQEMKKKREQEQEE
ncbi:MAG: hypothetical protein Q4F35_07050 [Akkermansia sp.]|nr:hypothetical protein [Akkermansia sp.]